MRNASPLLTAASLLLLTAIPAASQIRLGANGGLNLASAAVSSESDIVPDFESVTRMSLGASVEFPLTDSWGFQLAAGYSQKGSRSQLSEEGIDFDLTLETNYFELAALGVARFPLSGDRVSAHLLAGPALALEASCDVSTTATIAGTDVEARLNCSDADLLDRSTYDLGLAGGGGIEFGLTDRLGLAVGALYTFGLLDVDKAADDSLKHRVLSLRVGLVYSLPR